MNFQNQQQGVQLSSQLTKAGERLATEVAARHGVSADAASALLQAIIAGKGRQAQFSHPELGGMGQWSSGGMLMIGDMFNNGLKAKVSALADDLARAAMQEQALVEPVRPSSYSVIVSAPSRWPEDLGIPSSTGSQNDLHYAVFPASRRLAIITVGDMTIYDTEDHEISGLAQQQGSDQSLTLTSQHGPVPLSSLKPLDQRRCPPRVPEAGDSVRKEARNSEVVPDGPAQHRSSQERAENEHAAIFAKIEGLSDLHDKKIITPEEYAAKKAELLGRL